MLVLSHMTQNTYYLPYPFVTIYARLFVNLLPNVHRALQSIQQIKIDMSKFSVRLKKILGLHA